MNARIVDADPADRPLDYQHELLSLLGERSVIDVLAATPAEERRAAVEDLYWGILSSKEFLFNH